MLPPLLPDRTFTGGPLGPRTGQWAVLQLLPPELVMPAPGRPKGSHSVQDGPRTPSPRWPRVRWCLPGRPGSLAGSSVGPESSSAQGREVCRESSRQVSRRNTLIPATWALGLCDEHLKRIFFNDDNPYG